MYAGESSDDDAADPQILGLAVTDDIMLGMERVQKEPNMCKLDACQRDVFIEPKTGIRHDFCGRLNTRRIAYNTDR